MLTYRGGGGSAKGYKIKRFAKGYRLLKYVRIYAVLARRAERAKRAPQTAQKSPDVSTIAPTGRTSDNSPKEPLTGRYSRTRADAPERKTERNTTIRHNIYNL